MTQQKSKGHSSLSEDIKQKIEDDLKDEPATRLDIIRDTLNDVNHVIQTPKIFILINIILLLTIVFLGRIAILFVEPLPPTPSTEFNNYQGLLVSASRSFNPYYAATRGSGIHAYGIHASLPGSSHVNFSQVIDISHPPSRDDWKKIDRIKLDYQGSEYTLSLSDTTLQKDKFLLRNTSGCYGTKCYVSLRIHPNGGEIQQGNYFIRGYDADKEIIFTSGGHISRNDTPKSDALPLIDFDVEQQNNGDLAVYLLSTPPEKFVRIELHSAKKSGNVHIERRFILKDEDKVTFSLPRDTVGFKVYATDFKPPFHDRLSRRVRVYGSFPGY